ncbi:MAG: 1-(5-phosphoribosyl)-5-[(5-phosphoribosylamino)methylideneamino]imidazole-4-carboxamide isomerase [bacterium]|nr:1-(5-phosphoribosyl)-5-[(5-phosphoribosylamino)methylideneamino]imidazole-4-carboxamide isomerase [bacterium]
MIIYPAIDLRGGKVVRLREGDPNQQVTFSDDPLAAARRWIDAGAAWLHMVNLDGAFATANDNLRILEAVAHESVQVQFGGGLRQMVDIQHAIDAGAARVVLGTVAVQQPEIVEAALAAYGVERICVGLDARDGRVTTHGWHQNSEITPTALGKQMAARGIRHALFTDVSRDGGLSGANVDATIAVGRETGLNVIASGGITTVEEIAALAHSGTVAGAVIGMALYQGRITLQDALAAAQPTKEGQ